MSKRASALSLVRHACPTLRTKCDKILEYRRRSKETPPPHETTHCPMRKVLEGYSRG